MFSPAYTPTEQYANFAISFEEYTQKNNDRIFASLGDLYDPNMDAEWYLLAMREWLYEDIGDIKFSGVLNSWVTTFFLILNWITHTEGYKAMSEENISQKVIYFMGAINREHIPSSRSYDLAWSYNFYVEQLMRSNPPEGFIKNHDQKMRKLPCPIMYSENGKKFIQWIIHIFYNKFPSSAIQNKISPSSPQPLHPRSLDQKVLEWPYLQ